VDYATKALDYNRFDLDAWQARAVAHRLLRDRTAATSDIAAMQALDPLSHFAHFESAFWDGGASALQGATALIRNEMPAETLLELGLWYVEAGQLATADQLLALAPANAEVLYWRAFLHDRLGAADVAALLARADAQSPRLVFPSRVESAEVMTWAATRTTSWLPRYFLGLLRWSQGDSTAVRTLFNEVGETPTYAPFYAARSDLLKGTDTARARADLHRAAQLEPAEWRYGRALAERAIADGQLALAVSIASSYYRQAPRNSALGMLYARALLRNGEATAARQLLDTLVVLPYEGAGEAHELYREVNLLGAVERLRARDARSALLLIAKAREWPERLGAGRPYPADVDERLEDLLARWAQQGATPDPAVDRQARAMSAGSGDPLTQRVLRALLAPVPR
jgi:thioredoxin-like negative regulator of GroEL